MSTENTTYMVSLFDNFVKKINDENFSSIIGSIRSAKYKARIDKIQRANAEGKKEFADREKKSLPAFTPSGLFTAARRLDDLIRHTGLVHADFDSIGRQKLDETFRKLIGDPYTYACFKSPSGNGLKVFAKVIPDKDRHESNYRAVQEYYEKLTELPADHKCKDVTRLCFMSYDPDAYLNESSQVFEPIDPECAPLQEILDFTRKKESFYNGNRNNFVFQFACNANRHGVNLNETIAFCCERFEELESQEIATTVNSAYRSQKAEFGNFVNFVHGEKIAGNENSNKEELRSSPLIPKVVFENLPELLRKGVEAFDDQRERDIFLTGALGILSGCMPGVSGIYAQRKVYTNLYVFVVAPAASGKGALQSAKELADKYHAMVKQESERAQKLHKAELQAQGRSGMNAELPLEPKFRVVFIPANSSSAKLLIHLDQNGGTGIICETEADTLGNVFKQEWGTYSDILRKNFHHEKISISRKFNSEYCEVDNAQLALVLSGTPNQVSTLISSAEDGLMSRFIFYTFRSDPYWKDVSPAAKSLNLNDYFSRISEQVYEMTRHLGAHPTSVCLSPSQWQVLNRKFEEYLSHVTNFTSEEASSIVKRLGLILYRICMILTAIRKFENRDQAVEISCEDVDFETSLRLVDVYLQHSLLMFAMLPKQSPSHNGAGGQKKQFFNALPDQFQRAQAVALGPAYGMKSSTVDRFLKAGLENNYLTQSSYGVYQKMTSPVEY